MPDSTNLEHLIEEYRYLVSQENGEHDVSRGQGIDQNALVERLANEGDWTAQGATDVMRLAEDYGAFMLSNALALAIALDIEDGSRGF